MKGERRRQLKRTISVLMVIMMLAAMAVPTVAAGPEALNPDPQSQDSGGQNPGGDAQEPVNQTQAPADSTQNPTDDTPDPTDGTQNPAGDTQNSNGGTQPPAESEPDGGGAKTVTIHVEGSTGHTYELYQIFTGDPRPVMEDGTLLRYELANVCWGANAQFPNGAKGKPVTDDVLKVLETDANTIKKYANTDSTPYLIKEPEGVKVEPGYYLLKDKDGSLAGTDEAYTADVLRVLGEDITIKPKSAKPTVDKQVWDEPEDEDTANGSEAYPNNIKNSGWGETADHELYKPFQFKLTAHIPDEEAIDAYSAYKLVFHDAMSEGVTFDGIESIVVKADQDYVLKDGETDAIDDNLYEVDGLEAGEAGLDWTLTIPDLKKVVDGSIRNVTVEIIYNAYLNEDAEINETYNEGPVGTGNKNTVFLEYSNNPNAGGDGSVGKTEEDSVWVFTYKMLNKKVAIDDQPNGPYGSSDSYDGMEEKPLGGAGFRLYRVVKDADGNNVPGEEVPLVSVTAGTDAPADESAAADGSTAADGDSEAEEAGSGTAAMYRPVKEGETGQEIVSDETTGRFDIIGLDAGSYILRETDPPEGYNACDDIYITITANHCEDVEDGLIGKAEVSMSLDGERASGENKVVNMRGRLLPGTGGIGTTIFYTVGGILAVGAAILLIIRRRMRKAKKSMEKM